MCNHNSECKISNFVSGKFKAGARVIGLELIAHYGFSGNTDRLLMVM